MSSDPYLSQFVESFDFHNLPRNFVFHEEKGGHQCFKTYANKIAIAFRMYSKVMDLIDQ